jgi:putative ABC transport system permease protein
VWRFTPYVLKNVWRNRTRTALTVSGAAVALFVFTFVGAVQDGLAGLTRGHDAERSLVVFQANRFCPATSRLPERYVERVRKVRGVADAVPIQVFMNNCRASLDLVVFHGMPADRLRKTRDLSLSTGGWAEFEGRKDAALVGRALAARRGLAVGQRFTVGEVTVTVAGVYAAGSAAEESFVYTHLDFLQRTRGLNAVGKVTQIEVRLAEGADAQATCRAIDALFKNDFRHDEVPTDTRPKGVFQARAVGDLAEVIGFLHYLGYACVGLVLAMVATTSVMAVQDRVREYAVLQTLGFSGLLIFFLVLAESLLVSLAGGLAGVGAALAVLSLTGLAVGAEGVTIAFTASPLLAATGLAVTALVGMAAGLVPAWQAARAEIVASLRQV